MIRLHKFGLLSLLIAAIAVLGCGTSGDGNGGGDGGAGNGGAGSGGDTGNGGDAGNGGVGGTGGGVVPQGDVYSSQPRGAIRCLFVNQDGTSLVADASCPFSQTPPLNGPVAFYLLDLGEAMLDDSCVITYPEVGDEPQEVPIVNGQFEFEASRTDLLGPYTITVSGQFSDTGRVNGVATHSRDCPDGRNWFADLGCCSQCTFCR
jgi:hypothetical protein